MRTRSGDVDASLVPMIAGHMGIGRDKVEEILNQESGLRRVSRISQDMRELEGSADPRA